MKTRVTKIGKSGRATGKRQTGTAIRPAAKRSRPKAECARAPVVAAATVPDQKRPSGKLGQVLGAVAAKRGASLDELVELTGWLPHTGARRSDPTAPAGLCGRPPRNRRSQGIPSA